MLNGQTGSTLADFSLPSVPGNERLAIARIQEAVSQIELPQRRQDQLKTAVGEAVLNAIEHGNESRAELPVAVKLTLSGTVLAISVTDQGCGGAIIRHEQPDLNAKLAGLQPPRGWGQFLIERMVDELRVFNDARGHTVELVLYLEDEPQIATHAEADTQGGEHGTK